MIAEYIQAALEQAKIEQLEDNEGWYGEVPALRGVWAAGATPEEVRTDLPNVIAGWLQLRCERGLSIPTLNGIEYGHEIGATQAAFRTS